MRKSTHTAVCKQRAFAAACDGGSWISEEELSIALRAAGVSGEDVERYLATNVMGPVRDPRRSHTRKSLVAA